MMGETRQQEREEFATEMADIANKKISEICARHNIGITSATAIFITHATTCALELKSGKAEAEGEA